VDRDLHFTLGYQGLDLRSSPAAGQVVVLRSMGETGRFTDLRTVYNHGALDEIGPAVREDAERASEIVGADFLGVDVITRDASVPLATSGGVINEVNTTPALHHHYDRSTEAFPRIAPLILETLLNRDRARRASRGGSPSPSSWPG
jgi:cyanophycin synthetase